MIIPVYCETAELAIEAKAVADAIGLAIHAQVAADALRSAALGVKEGGLSAAICIRMPEPARTVDALHVCSEHGRIVVGAVSSRESEDFGFAADLGIVCVRDVAPVLAALCLLQHGAQRPWRANTRRLSSADQARLVRYLGSSERSAGRLVSDVAIGVSYQLSEQADAIPVGQGLAVAEALRALRAATPAGDTTIRVPPPADLSITRDILFGPPRLLSDPASKAALLPFELPLPQEELCSSPSRAAAEAARIGFPVRISLASPDLRIWDHPELSVDGVDNAARVRDIYRQLVSAAQQLAPEARVLGVTVTATTLARALLRVSARPAPRERVLLRVGFSDPHGAITKDSISTALPASRAAIERALARLSGEILVLGETNGERERNLTLLSQLFGQVAAFIDLHRKEVERLELHPVALLVGGGAEIREAAVEVTDAFVRELA